MSSDENGSRFQQCPVCKQLVVKYLLAHHIDSKCEMINTDSLAQTTIDKTYSIVKPGRSPDKEDPIQDDESDEFMDDPPAKKTKQDSHKKRQSSDEDQGPLDTFFKSTSPKKLKIFKKKPAVVNLVSPEQWLAAKQKKKDEVSPYFAPASDLKDKKQAKLSFGEKPKSIPQSKPVEQTKTDITTPPLTNESIVNTQKEPKKATIAKNAPLAERMRPSTFDEFVGQEEVTNGMLGPFLNKEKIDYIPSIVLFGPPGVGKTTFAKLLAERTGFEFICLSAVDSDKKQIKEAMQKAQEKLKYYKRRTILFIDEIHRYNKAQQDFLLPYVENGTIILIGATTENPSFEVIGALLSRCKVVVLKKLSVESIVKILQSALTDTEKGLGMLNLEADEEVLTSIATIADGDARNALNMLEMASSIALSNDSMLTMDIVKQSLQRTHIFSDKNGEEHYNLISALHKSMRGSDVDASLYWLARMLESGQDPLYVARRLIRFASEDIGLADPMALIQANNGFQSAHSLGMPECNVVLAQVVAYMARAPKSNSLYVAYEAIKEIIHKEENPPVPLHLRNAPTKLMKELGYSKGYLYNPDFINNPEVIKEQNYLPESLKDKKFFVFKQNKVVP